MSVTDITPLETELAFCQSQQQKQVPAHKKVSKPRLTRYKKYMKLEQPRCAFHSYNREWCIDCNPGKGTINVVEAFREIVQEAKEKK